MTYHTILQGNYPELYTWSISHYDLFWEEVFNFTGIRYSKLYNQVIKKQEFLNDVTNLRVISRNRPNQEVLVPNWLITSHVT